MKECVCVCVLYYYVYREGKGIKIRGGQKSKENWYNFFKESWKGIWSFPPSL